MLRLFLNKQRLLFDMLGLLFDR